jgi:tetratricopeptide (TPR) repeat protein
MTHSEPERTGGGQSVAKPPGVPRQRTTLQSRVEGLAPQAIRFLQVAARSLDLRDLDTAAAALRDAQALAPDHPEVLRLQSLLEYRRGRFADATALLRRVLATWPDDALALGNLGAVLADGGHVAEALVTLNRACQVAPDQAGGWFNLGKLLDSQAHVAEAEKAFQTALERDPRHLSARIAHAATLATLGRTAEAAAEYRSALAQEPRSAQAWIGLANLKTVRLDVDEAAALERLHADPSLSEADRSVVGFALGKVLEDSGRHADAFAVFSSANAARRRTSPWDATAFSRQVDAIASAFSAQALPDAIDPALGEPVIFVVSLPRSGSTLIEQILAAHPDVEGASELPDLETVVLEESARRGRRFPDWVAQATAEDWQRLGQRYLQRTARWRKRRPRFTDKMPDNWLLVGAALAMLPGARVVNVRRDAVETCWSCFKQLFGAGRHAYSYDLADLAETWRDYDRLGRLWASRFPDRVREQSYERLIADPETETRALLDFCRLPFDSAVLRFHEAERSVRTASAAQVREPLRSDTARSAAYGERLEPLRRMLGAPAGSDGASPPGEGRSAPPAHLRDERTQGLDDDSARDLLHAAALIGSGRADQATPLVERVRDRHPEHAEVLRLLGALDSARGRHVEALAALKNAAASKPDDALILNTLGAAQAAAGDADAALASFARACEIDPLSANARHNLGNMLASRGEIDAARAAFEQALAIEPGLVPARIALADVLRRLDRIDDAAAHLREALARDPHSSAAWEALAELCPGELTAAERNALETEYPRPRRSDDERAALGYALANVLESRARYPEAFAAFVSANALRRREVDWDGARHSHRCKRILEAFPASPSLATSSLGEGLVIVLGMPDTLAASVAPNPRAAARASRSGRSRRRRRTGSASDARIWICPSRTSRDRIGCSMPHRSTSRSRARSRRCCRRPASSFRARTRWKPAGRVSAAIFTARTAIATTSPTSRGSGTTSAGCCSAGTSASPIAFTSSMRKRCVRTAKPRSCGCSRIAASTTTRRQPITCACTSARRRARTVISSNRSRSCSRPARPDRLLRTLER